MLTGDKKFAIFLCNFTDSQNPEPRSKEEYENVFLNNSDSINQYWMDNSKEVCSIRGSKVFGWFTLPYTSTEFIARLRTLTTAPQLRIPAVPEVQRILQITDSEGKYHFSDDSFDYIIAIFSDSIADEGNYGRTIVGDNILGNDIINRDTHTFFCHEMAHAMCQPVDHSFDFYLGIYNNWTDIMSARTVHSAPHSGLHFCGPNLCSVNKEILGWIPQNRILEYNDSIEINEEIEIVSRSYSDIEGIELVKISGLYIEFVSKDKWDLGVPHSGIVINENIGGKAYVVVKDRNQPYDQIWRTNMFYGNKQDNNFDWYFGRYFYIEVMEINNETKKSRIRIERRHINRKLFGVEGVFVGRGGEDDGPGIMIVNGKIKRIPPWSPVAKILNTIGSLFIKLSFSLLSSKNSIIGQKTLK